jgi:TRAP transporter TAXI family solute receptor
LNKIVARGALAAAFVAAPLSLASAQQLKLMTGPQGGSWYPLGGAIQNIVETNMPGTKVQVLPGAGIANVKGVEGGKADLGFANSVSTVDAVQGKPPFDTAAQDTCHVATLYPQYFQVVALADSGISSPADVKGKAAAVQPKGNTAEAITEHMLQAYGMEYDDLSQVNYGSYTDAVSLLKDGNAAFFTLGTTVPAGAIMDLASARDVTIVPIDDQGLAKMQEINPGYRRAVVKAGSYPGQDADVPTIGYATHLIARCSLDEETVYNILKNLHANLDSMTSIAKAMEGITPQEMAADVGVPLHAGAKRFYEEQGVSVN